MAHLFGRELGPVCPSLAPAGGGGLAPRRNKAVNSLFDVVAHGSDHDEPASDRRFVSYRHTSKHLCLDSLNTCLACRQQPDRGWDEFNLENAPVAWVRTAPNEPGPLKVRDNLVHGLRREESQPGNVGVRSPGIGAQHR